ncbi:hypothetical protein JI721_04545 [Alicyclobacillus cycloheptanicus]|uniref:CARDB domain-containing protein n=1 Tax=Alicyclobacillus cycloheptanicus TaxID=1457 RepID=A0ABT9XIV0_9BACL|nr:hypothetical protein [Alicyclobacillus cycloheptanicus]MDQ0190127.1 hypothetical protein [Alicyclobacillus cycloheptanicus]WDM02099.1 hypothetical protein JI721_04545 [Alicyclobacillus cycloheptanicus]
MKSLTLLEAASALSAMGSVAIAITTLYQIRRSSRESVLPLVYPEFVSVDEKTIQVKLRNYGRGPAIDVQMTLFVGGRPVYFTAYKNKQRVTFLNIATNESEALTLCTDEPAADLLLRLRYKSVLREKFHRRITVRNSEVLGLDGNPSLLVRIQRLGRGTRRKRRAWW